MQRLLIVIVSSVIGCAACQRTEDKPAAQVVQPSAAPVAQPLADAKGKRYAFSNAESKLEFVGAKITGKQFGSFGAFRGTIVVPEQDVNRGSVTVEIDTPSLETDAPRLTTHLKSEDFFDVARHPQAKFQSTALEASADKSGTHVVTGNLTLHGVTKTIRFPATIRASEQKVEVQSEFNINRKDFGIVYPGKPDDLISDDVLVKLNLVAAPVG